ncbi:MFS transporter [Nocardiopsis listeri]|uniref:MFS transporter n=1 Tax=Nocardiopsis listeri TaxID=53440 RepID=UPI00082EDBFE|nr:MFS transporter [Nocardiopsis listeri]
MKQRPTSGDTSPLQSAPVDAPQSRHSGVLVVLLLASTLAVMAGSVVSPVIEVIRGDLGLSGTAGGMVIAAHAAVIAVTSPLIGRLIDRWGMRLPLTLGLIVYGVAGGAGLLTSTYATLIASRIVFGLGAAAVFAGTTVAMLQMFSGPERDRVMGWRSSANSVGGLLWPLLGGLLGGLSWHGPFALYLVGLPMGLVALWALPRTPPPAAERGRIGLGALFRQSPTLVGFYLLQATASVFLYATVVFLPQRLADLGIHQPVAVSLYSVVTTAAVGSLAGLSYARLRSKLSYGALLRLSALAWTGAFLVLGTVEHSWLLLVGPALLGVGQGLSLPTLTVLINDRAPAESRGQAASLSGTVIFGGQFISPLLLGPLIGATSSTTGFLVTAVFGALLTVGLLLLRISPPGK